MCMGGKRSEYRLSLPRLPQPVRLAMTSRRTPGYIRLAVPRQRQIVGHSKTNRSRSRNFLFICICICICSRNRICIRHIPPKARHHHTPPLSTSTGNQLRPNHNPYLPTTYPHLPVSIYRCSPRLRRQIRRCHHRPINPVHLR